MRRLAASFFHSLSIGHVLMFSFVAELTMPAIAYISTPTHENYTHYTPNRIVFRAYNTLFVSALSVLCLSFSHSFSFSLFLSLFPLRVLPSIRHIWCLLSRISFSAFHGHLRTVFTFVVWCSWFVFCCCCCCVRSFRFWTISIGNVKMSAIRFIHVMLYACGFPSLMFTVSEWGYIFGCFFPVALESILFIWVIMTENIMGIVVARFGRIWS